MPTPGQKKSESKKGEKHHLAKSTCAFGKLYPTATDASDTLREVCNTKSEGNFIKDWIKNKKHQHNVFYVTKDFYEQYKNTDECVTRDMYDQFIS